MLLVQLLLMLVLALGRVLPCCSQRLQWLMQPHRLETQVTRSAAAVRPLLWSQLSALQQQQRRLPLLRLYLCQPTPLVQLCSLHHQRLQQGQQADHHHCRRPSSSGSSSHPKQQHRRWPSLCQHLLERLL